MKKENLKFGNIIELRIGYRFIYHQTCGESLLNLNGTGVARLDLFNEDLFNEDLIHCYEPRLDIVKVYEDYTCTKVLWERKEKPELTEDEKPYSIEELLNDK